MKFTDEEIEATVYAIGCSPEQAGQILEEMNRQKEITKSEVLRGVMEKIDTIIKENVDVEFKINGELEIITRNEIKDKIKEKFAKQNQEVKK